LRREKFSAAHHKREISVVGGRGTLRRFIIRGREKIQQKGNLVHDRQRRPKVLPIFMKAKNVWCALSQREDVLEIEATRIEKIKVVVRTQYR